jgi:hypothetical protein
MLGSAREFHPPYSSRNDPFCPAVSFSRLNLQGSRAGKQIRLFLVEKPSVLALGWKDVPDVSTVPDKREAFKKVIAEIYPTANPGSVANNAGQLFRFVHEMKDGELALYPCKSDREIHFGRVTGPYFYSVKNKSFPQREASQMDQECLTLEVLTGGTLRDRICSDDLPDQDLCERVLDRVEREETRCPG